MEIDPPILTKKNPTNTNSGKGGCKIQPVQVKQEKIENKNKLLFLAPIKVKREKIEIYQPDKMEIDDLNDLADSPVKIKQEKSETITLHFNKRIKLENVDIKQEKNPFSQKSIAIRNYEPSHAPVKTEIKSEASQHDSSCSSTHQNNQIRPVKAEKEPVSKKGGKRRVVLDLTKNNKTKPSSVDCSVHQVKSETSTITLSDSSCTIASATETAQPNELEDCETKKNLPESVTPEPNPELTSEIKGEAIMNVKQEVNTKTADANLEIKEVGAGDIREDVQTDTGEGENDLFGADIDENKFDSLTAPYLGSGNEFDVNYNYANNAALLSEEQRAIIDLVINQKKNVFITGSAGTGKSFVLQAIISQLFANYGNEFFARVAVTAPTGIAAVNIRGITIHRWAGIRCAANSKQLGGAWKVRARWRAVRVLIIDEVSMLSAVMFHRLEKLAREIRLSEKPFGGIQLVLCGDFFQLAPINSNLISTDPTNQFVRPIFPNGSQTEVFLDPVFANFFYLNIFNTSQFFIFIFFIFSIIFLLMDNYFFFVLLATN